MEYPLQIETERLLLRACMREDLLKIYRGDINKMETAEGWPLRDLKEALPHFLNDLLDDPTSIGWNVWLLQVKANSMIIGDVGFKGTPDENGTVEIGYSIAPSYRKIGYAREGVRALVYNAFKTGTVKRVIAECSENNLPSIEILRSIGFKIFKKEYEMLFYSIDKNTKLADPDRTPVDGPGS